MIDTLSVRQTALICSIMIFASKLLVLPSLLYEANKSASLLSLILLFLIDILIILLAVKIKEKYNNLSIFEIISQKIGIFLTKIIFFLLFLFFFIKLLYIFQEAYTFLKQSLYNEASIFVFLICLLPVCNAMVVRGFRAFGRTVEIFYIFILMGIIFSSAIWIASVFGSGINIFNNNGLSGFISATFNYSFWFGDFLFIFIFMDKIKIKNNFGAKILKSVFFVILIVIFFFFAYFFIYQNTSFYHTFAILDIVQFSSEIGNIGKLDIFAITTFMFLLFFQGTVFFFCCEETLSKFLPTKSIFQNLIIIDILIFVVMYLISNNLNYIIKICSQYAFYFAIFICYIIPLIIYICYKLKKKGAKNEK